MWGRQPLILVHTHQGLRCRGPLAVSGVSAQGIDRGAHPPRCFGSVCQAVEPLILMHTDPRLCVCCPGAATGAAGHGSGCVPTRGFRCELQATDCGMRPLGHFGSVCPGSWSADQGAFLLGISVVGPQSSDVGGCQPDFRYVLGCLSQIHSPGP